MPFPSPSQGVPPNLPSRRWLIGGLVQGVGYRPFVFRLAQRLGLKGWVRNQRGAVEVLGQGQPPQLDAFGKALLHAAPPPADPRLLAVMESSEEPLACFAIQPGDDQPLTDLRLPLDRPPCPACLAELRDPHDRRYRYPFISCSACGPRYTVIARLPYDRANTTLRGFPLCADCAREYTDPQDRRFHAQSIGCPACGPRLEFVTPGGATATADAALAACVTALRAGRIVGVKGIGGYHLMCAAHDADAVARLRRNKPRPDKPLAVMFPEDAALGIARRHLHLDACHEAALYSAERPIVLTPKRSSSTLPAAIAPGLNEIGALLPYSPLHHLLLDAVGAPLVATSANVSGEPVLTTRVEAEARLGHVADAWLHHDRPIERRADDSVCRVIAGAARPLRLGRGHAPRELELPRPLDRPLLAVGGHLKTTVALAWGRRVAISPHLGDLESPRARAAFATTVEELQSLYGIRAQTVACDRHPGYASRRWAQASGLPVREVLHHHAHASALAGEYPTETRWLVFAWDGLGYGADGTLWGGEALLGTPGNWRRVASFRPFRLPGGERAAREPWRSALALCWESGHRWNEAPDDGGLLHQAWRQRLNCPPTSAVGRLFDAAAALTGLLSRASYEGQAPALLEAMAEPTDDFLALPATPAGELLLTDWAPLLPMLTDAALSPTRRTGLFHASLAQALLAQAQAVRERYGEVTVGLGGGVFQNRRLSEQACALLAAAGFTTRLARAVPCNDAGLSYGQVIEVLHRHDADARSGGGVR